MIKELLKKHKILFLIFLAIIFYLIFISIVVTVLPKETKNISSIAPTPVFDETEKEPYHTDSLGVTQKDADAQIAPKQLGVLIRSLPYKSDLFELSYDYLNDSFLFLSNRSRTLEANTELSKLLNEYNLKKTDLTNLKSGFK